MSAVKTVIVKNQSLEQLDRSQTTFSFPVWTSGEEKRRETEIGESTEKAPREAGEDCDRARTSVAAVALDGLYDTSSE